MSDWALTSRNASLVEVYWIRGIKIARRTYRDSSRAYLARQLAICADIVDDKIIIAASTHANIVLEVESESVIASQAVGCGGCTGEAVAIAWIALESDCIGNIIVDWTSRSADVVEEVGIEHTSQTV